MLSFRSSASVWFVTLLEGNNFQCWKNINNKRVYELVREKGLYGCRKWKHQNKKIIPAKMTIPKHHSVFLSTQPLSSIFSLSREYLLSLQYKVPVNLSSLLFGGSQMTSPEEQRTGSLTNISYHCRRKFMHSHNKIQTIRVLHKCKNKQICQALSHHQSPLVL